MFGGFWAFLRVHLALTAPIPRQECCATKAPLFSRDRHSFYHCRTLSRPRLKKTSGEAGLTFNLTVLPYASIFIHVNLNCAQTCYMRNGYSRRHSTFLCTLPFFCLQEECLAFNQRIKSFDINYEQPYITLTCLTKLQWYRALSNCTSATYQKYSRAPLFQRPPLDLGTVASPACSVP